MIFRRIRALTALLGFILGLVAVLAAPGSAFAVVGVSTGHTATPGSTYDTTAYTYDAPAPLSSPDTATSYVRGSPSRPEAVSWASPVFVSRDVAAAETAGDTPYLYRGLAADHPALGDAANGIARPRGGHSNPELHNGGNTMSEFTSWTTEESIARDIAAEANGPGTVLRIPNADGPGYVRVPSPDVYGESEVLIRGPVTGAGVLPWEPR